MLVSRSGPGCFREKESEFACLESEDEGGPQGNWQGTDKALHAWRTACGHPTYFMLCAGHSDQEKQAPKPPGPGNSSTAGSQGAE